LTRGRSDWLSQPWAGASVLAVNLRLWIIGEGSAKTSVGLVPLLRRVSSCQRNFWGTSASSLATHSIEPHNCTYAAGMLYIRTGSCTAFFEIAGAQQTSKIEQFACQRIARSLSEMPRSDLGEDTQSHTQNLCRVHKDPAFAGFGRRPSDATHCALHASHSHFWHTLLQSTAQAHDPVGAGRSAVYICALCAALARVQHLECELHRMQYLLMYCARGSSQHAPHFGVGLSSGKARRACRRA